MLKRKIENKFNDFFNTKINKALIVEGARQIGKTYSIREYCKNRFASYLEINFQESPQLRNIFDGDISSKTIIDSLLLNFYDFKFIENDTLIFLDEIQDCPNAITALKFLAQDERIKVVASGSSLGLNYKNQTSFPVGYVEIIDMYSLDFEEFLWALGIQEDIVENIKEYFESYAKVPEAIHTKMMEYMKQYLVVGGMPEIVNLFVESKNYQTVDDAQRQLYRLYYADIATYADPDIKIKAQKCYSSIPVQLNKPNHKFQYKYVEKEGNERKFGSSLDWLTNANMTVPVYNINSITYPLEIHKIDNNLRIYYNDISFMISTYPYEIKRLLLSNEDNDTKSNIVLASAKGGIYEALAADILHKSGIDKLYFYRNDAGTIEIEFLIENIDGIIPIEIKANRGRSKSLGTIINKENIKLGYKFTSQNIGFNKDKNIITMPIYALPFIFNNK